jgi:hypothetical protein
MRLPSADQHEHRDLTGGLGVELELWDHRFRPIGIRKC